MLNKLYNIYTGLINKFEELKSKIKETEEYREEQTDAEFIPDDQIFVFDISYDTNNEVKFTLLWDKNYQSEKFAILMGSIIKTLTSGGYDEDIVNCLQSADTTLKEDKEFVDLVSIGIMTKVHTKEEQETIAKLPVVNPLRTFGESNFGTQGQIL